MIPKMWTRCYASEIRNSNIEIRNNIEIQMIKIQKSFEFIILKIRICLGFVILDLVFSMRSVEW